MPSSRLVLARPARSLATSRLRASCAFPIAVTSSLCTSSSIDIASVSPTVTGPPTLAPLLERGLHWITSMRPGLRPPHRACRFRLLLRFLIPPVTGLVGLVVMGSGPTRAGTPTPTPRADVSPPAQEDLEDMC